MANEDKSAVSADQKKGIEAHLANPQGAPLPSGISINFGDTNPYRVATKDEQAASEPAPNADAHPEG